MLDTDAAWRKWGLEDPYFGVLADERFTAARIAENRELFLESGRAFVADLIAAYEQRLGALPRGRALDHGCGTGRLTLPLAAEFAEVVALDVSPAMLAEAARNADRNNIRFALADDALSEAPGPFDLVNSHLVLQHVPVRRGLPILEALIDRVAPGGGFHVSVSVRLDRGPKRWLYWASANIPGVKIWQNLCAGRRWNAPAMQMNDYPLNTILKSLAERGITQVWVSTTPYERFMTCSIMGRRPPPDALA